ncbi:MerR family transcriptional regulator [Actinomyces viscosus]|uniref:HTH-type transcriptional regulator AdhR n=1 Tax=Actinomyces viscosus TaxID=1656 RepID=A0A3S4VYG8_ACTVI|nr:MerR family transcriptional regulator [Actinomyces viscosus]TFH52204.1 MerR family transcriptional regulator [Actinomyces viscosus]VEI17732.1 HTH-type transcriptional regulator AdhR [Actinomyces viscosus]
MTTTSPPGGEPDGARLREALRLASVPPSDDVGPGPWPDAAGWDIATTAERLGVSAHTLRYYERIGLVRVGRAASGHRRYDAAAVRRLVFLTRMRASGMTIHDLRRYVGMVEAGRDTVPERLAMLTEHREALQDRIDELRLALEATDYKIAGYTRQLEEQAAAKDADAAAPGTRQGP